MGKAISMMEGEAMGERLSREQALELWIKAPRNERDAIYAEYIFPLFKEEFKKKPLVGWTLEEKPRVKALISVLGFSWQPAALMITWTEPDYVLFIATEESASLRVKNKPVVELISELTGLSRDRMEIFRAGDDEVEIYRKVKEFVSSKNLSHSEIAVDLTGGKKFMSAVTALAGFLTGCILMYVDYGKYDPAVRAPLPFSEYPRLIHNPLDVFGDVEKKKIADAFNTGKFELAQELCREMKSKLYDPRELEILEFLSRGYASWHRFNFKEAKRHLQRAKELGDRFYRIGKWRWYGALRSTLSENIKVLEELEDAKKRVCSDNECSYDAVKPLILNHLSSAKRYADYGEYTIALMLLYSTVEKICDAVLLIDYGVEDEKPDYSKIPVDWEIYHQKGRKFMGTVYQKREPAGPITYSIGVQLVASLREEIIPEELLPKLYGLAQIRNKCEFEHGFCPEPVDERRFKEYRKVVQCITENFMREYKDTENLEGILSRYRFPKLSMQP